MIALLKRLSIWSDESFLVSIDFAVLYFEPP